MAYRMAEIHPKEVERVVLVSSGICYSDEEKEGHLEKIGKNPLKFLLPETPEDLRYLVKLSLYKYDILKWVPDYFLQEFINVSNNISVLILRQFIFDNLHKLK